MGPLLVGLQHDKSPGPTINDKQALPSIEVACFSSFMTSLDTLAFLTARGFAVLTFTIGGLQLACLYIVECVLDTPFAIFLASAAADIFSGVNFVAFFPFCCTFFRFPLVVNGLGDCEWRSPSCVFAVDSVAFVGEFPATSLLIRMSKSGFVSDGLNILLHGSE